MKFLSGDCSGRIGFSFEVVACLEISFGGVSRAFCNMI